VKKKYPQITQIHPTKEQSRLMVEQPVFAVNLCNQRNLWIDPW